MTLQQLYLWFNDPEIRGLTGEVFPTSLTTTGWKSFNKTSNRIQAGYGSESCCRKPIN